MLYGWLTNHHQHTTMPLQMYAAGEYDLAGFAVGAVRAKDLLPRLDSSTQGVKPGCVLLGLASSGLVW